MAQAVAAARAAQPAWAERPDAERKALTLKLAEVLGQHAEELAALGHARAGKPLGGVGPDQVPGARFEIFGLPGLDPRSPPAWICLPTWCLKTTPGATKCTASPLCVIAAIAPWNWPLLIAIWQIIIHPRGQYGGHQAVGIHQHRHAGNGAPAGRRVATRRHQHRERPRRRGRSPGGPPGVDKIMFTGSGSTGARIAATAAKHLPPRPWSSVATMPAIVLPDADPKAIAMGLFWGAFPNMGQTCACAKRLYVPDALHDAVVGELAAARPPAPAW